MAASVLTEEEKKIEYSRLFYKPLEKVDPQLLDILKKSPVKPEQITSIYQRNDILKPGYLEVENGYAKMDDGSGCAATKIEMPDVTPEMIEWWFAWHGLKSLRYKIWCPTDHYEAHVREEDLSRRLDQSLSLKERNWGTTDIVTENVGGGPQTMCLAFLSPEDFGYDPALIANADVIVSANVSDAKTGAPLICFSHVIRKIEKGIEYRSHYWQGYNINAKGEPEAVAIPDGGFPMEVMKSAAEHSLTEYSNLAVLLPQLYDKYKNCTDLTMD